MAQRVDFPWLGASRKGYREAWGWRASAGTGPWWASYEQPKHASPRGEGTLTAWIPSNPLPLRFPTKSLFYALHHGSVVVFVFALWPGLIVIL